MEQSILKSTKKVLHIAPDDDSFDLDVLTQINSAFSTLNDLGVGPDLGFAVESVSETWTDFLPGAENHVQRSQVKNFVLLAVRLAFDPPQTTFHIAAAERQLEEMTARISMRRENVEWVDPSPPNLLIVDGGDPSGEV